MAHVLKKLENNFNAFIMLIFAAIADAVRRKITEVLFPDKSTAMKLRNKPTSPEEKGKKPAEYNEDRSKDIDRFRTNFYLTPIFLELIRMRNCPATPGPPPPRPTPPRRHHHHHHER